MIDYCKLLKTVCETSASSRTIALDPAIDSFLDIVHRNLEEVSKENLRQRTGFVYSKEIKTINPEHIINIALGLLVGDYKLQKPLREDELTQISTTLRESYAKKPNFNKSLALREELKHIKLNALEFYEVISKKIARNPMPLGAQVFHFDDQKLKSFTCEKIIHKEGLKAYFFSADDADESSFILFRPTVRTYDDDGLKTIMEDCQDLIGTQGYRAAYQDFKEHFEKNPSKVHLVGFSLGGVHAARLLADFPHVVSKAYFYNDPSTEEELNFKFLDYLKSHKDQQIELNIAHHTKDLICWLGQMHIGYKPQDQKEDLRHLKVRYYHIEHDCEKFYAAKKARSFFQKTFSVNEYVRYHTNIQIAPALKGFYSRVFEAIDLGADRQLLYYKNRPPHTKWIEERRQNWFYVRRSMAFIAHTIHRLIQEALKTPSRVRFALDRMYVAYQKMVKTLLHFLIEQINKIRQLIYGLKVPAQS